MSDRKSWWGPREGPSQLASAEAGWPVVNLDAGRSGAIAYRTAPQSQRRTPDVICSFTSPIPVSVCVHVNVLDELGSSSASPNSPRRVTLFAGSDSFDSMGSHPRMDDLGMLVLEYGDLSVTRRVAMDMRAGTYQLPPVQQAKLSSLVYRPQGTGGVGPYLISAAMSPGITTQPSRPWVTCGKNLGPNSDQVIAVPDGARWVDIWAEGTAAGSALELTNTNEYENGQPIIRRDYENNIFTPPWGPVEIAHHGNVTLRNVNASGGWSWCRFFLEL